MTRQVWLVDGPRLVWMSGPPEAIEHNAYTHGPVPYEIMLCADDGDIIVGKNRRGDTVLCETMDGHPYPIPKSHTVPTPQSDPAKPHGSLTYPIKKGG